MEVRDYQNVLEKQSHPETASEQTTVYNYYDDRKCQFKNLKKIINVTSMTKENNRYSKLDDGGIGQLRKSHLNQFKKLPSPGILSRKSPAKEIRAIESDESLAVKSKFTLPFVQRIEPRDKIASTLKYGEENIKQFQEKNSKGVGCQNNVSKVKRNNSSTASGKSPRDFIREPKSNRIQNDLKYKITQNPIATFGTKKRSSDHIGEYPGGPILSVTSSDPNFSPKKFLKSQLSLGYSVYDTNEPEYQSIPLKSMKGDDLYGQYELNNISQPESPQKYSDYSTRYLENKGFRNKVSKPKRLVEFKSNLKKKMSGSKQDEFYAKKSKHVLDKVLKEIISPKKAKECDIKRLVIKGPVRKPIYSSLDIGIEGI